MFSGGSGGGGGAPVVATWQRLGQALRLSGWEAGATGVNGQGTRAPEPALVASEREWLPRLPSWHSTVPHTGSPGSAP